MTNTTGHGFSMLAAAGVGPDKRISPFDARFHLSFSDIDPDPFVTTYYGHGNSVEGVDKSEVDSNASWRRIDNEWLYSAESLALQLNTGINNTSLVLAFELPVSRKTLLFAGDAQRGNWVSWPESSWGSGEAKVTVQGSVGTDSTLQSRTPLRVIMQLWLA